MRLLPELHAISRVKCFDRAMEPERVLVRLHGSIYAGLAVQWFTDKDLNVRRILVRLTINGHQAEMWFPPGAVRPAADFEGADVEPEWAAEAVDRFLLQAGQAESDEAD